MGRLSKFITFLGADLEVEYTVSGYHIRDLQLVKVFAGHINITELLSEQVLTDIEDHIIDGYHN